MSVEIRVPQMGESVTEAVVGQWLKKEGDAVTPSDTIVTLETDKVALEVPAEHAGLLQKIAQPEGATVNVGDLLATIADGDVSKDPGPSTIVATSSAVPVSPSSDVSGNGARATSQEAVPQADLSATPVARRIAAASNVDLEMVSGSGRGGRRTKDDVATFLERGTPSTDTPAMPVTTVVPRASASLPLAALFPVPEREERQRLSRRRQTIARRLVEAQHAAAMLTTFNELDMSAVMDVRKRRRDSFKERHGVGLGFMSFFTKAVVGALKSFPRLNAEIQGDEVVLKRHYDIGVAVGAEEGLVVPVLRDADRKSFAAIEQEIADMATRARANKLTLAELQGGTFTITNGGIFGSLLSTPILNAPEVGILGMHKIEERPVARNGEVVIRPMMYVALTYDHRIVDGREAVQFLVRVKDLIEDPETLLLEG